VDASADGAVVWDILQVQNYDLLVTDSEMPKLTVVGLLKMMQAARMAMLVVMATGKNAKGEIRNTTLASTRRYPDQALYHIEINENGGGGSRQRCSATKMPIAYR